MARHRRSPDEVPEELPRRVPGRALGRWLRDEGTGPDAQDARDALTRGQAADRMRHPWRGRRRKGWFDRG